MRERKKLHVMSIVHGKSEYNLCTSIRSNLRLKHEIIGKKRGANSIQITDLMNELNRFPFKSVNDFISKYPVVDRKGGRLHHFTLFPIMDVDDCTVAQKRSFKSGDMFRGHWLHEHIVPIYSDPNLEETMRQSGIEVSRKKDYIKIFPTNQGDLDLEMAREFLDKLRRCNCSNLDKYVEYCLRLATGGLARN